MTAPLKIETATGLSLNYEASQGMMAGQISVALNDKISQYGINASAYNFVELYEIPSETVQFDLKGDNFTPARINLDMSSGNIQALVNQINTYSESTGIFASKSASNALVLEQRAGNDINIEAVSISGSGSIKVRQLDQYGEVINSPQNTASPAPEISTGKYAILGGQIQFTSPSDFQLSTNDVDISVAQSEFASGFIKRTFEPEKSSTSYSFKTLKHADDASIGAAGLASVAASSSYKFEIKGDDSKSNLVAKIAGLQSEDLSGTVVAEKLASELRQNSVQAGIYGNTFSFSDGFPSNGDTLEFRLGDQKYRATLNDVPSFVIEGNNVKIDGKTYSQTEALKQIVSLSSFTISGPEDNRIRVGFTEASGGFKLYAVANDGVISGHSLRLTSNNSSSNLNAFHFDNASSAFIQGSEFDISNAANQNIAELVVGATTTSIRFENGVISPTTLAGLGINISLEQGSANTKRFLKISIPNSVADQDIRLKAIQDSSNFGIKTASTQLTLDGSGFSLSEYGNDRIKVTGSVQSLASETISIDGLSGEDLIVISTGNVRPSILGAATASTNKLNPREISAQVTSDDGRTVVLKDEKTGDYLGSRTLSSTNNFQFRGFDWQFDSIANKNDEFLLSTSGNRQDDASNLVRFNRLASLSETNGKGGYSQIYSNLVTDTGFKSREAEQRLETTQAIHDVALDRKSEFSGVDLDTEAARLLEQQQAYQALAKVLSTAKELVDTLLRSF
jgi:flagellar hook-associated protein 1 FlgK